MHARFEADLAKSSEQVVAVRPIPRPAKPDEPSLLSSEHLDVSLLASLLGWALLAILERHTHRPRTARIAASGLVLLLSLAGPLTSATNTGSTLILLMMHIGLAAVLVPMLAATLPTHFATKGM